ncbi:MAG: hypothetical protein N2Z68_00320 [Patescibacteria group bacterium]|nr:hypothetical protein [Patescibacteria group bacterium]
MVVKLGTLKEIHEREYLLRQEINKHYFEIQMRPSPQNIEEWRKLIAVEEALLEILNDPETLSETIKIWYAHPRTLALFSDVWMSLGFHIHKVSTRVPDAFVAWVLNKLLDKLAWNKKIKLT